MVVIYRRQRNRSATTERALLHCITLLHLKSHCAAIVTLSLGLEAIFNPTANLHSTARSTYSTPHMEAIMAFTAANHEEFAPVKVPYLSQRNLVLLSCAHCTAFKHGGGTGEGFT